MIILGIDPGKHGALVLLNGRDVLYQCRTSTLLAPGRWEASADVLAAALRSLHAEHRIGLAVLELYAGRAGQGRGSMLTIGVGWGLLRGLLAALEIPTLTPTSAAVARRMFAGVAGDGKERAVAVAMSVLPGLELCPGRVTKAHSGLADAAVLALWGQSHPLGAR